MIIYKITNKQNKKLYIGLTKQTLEKRWQNHLNDYKTRPENSKLYNAFLKNGTENFYIEQIDSAKTIQELSDKEIYWIKELDTIKNGYNILKGGLFFNSDNLTDWWESLSPEDKDIYCKNMSKTLQGRRNAGSGSSQYFGVYKNPHSWTCCIKINKKKYRRNFKTEIEAAIAYDKLALYFYDNQAKTNFPTRYTKQELEDFMPYFLIDKRWGLRSSNNKYVNVGYSKTHNQWVAIVILNNKKQKKRAFYRNTEEEAYLAQQEFIANM